MPTSPRQEEQFKKLVGDELPKALLGSCIDWIRDSMAPDQVFDQDTLRKFIRNTDNCDDVFDRPELEKWAEENGYMKISELSTLKSA
jgi:hypothetical protein